MKTLYITIAAALSGLYILTLVHEYKTVVEFKRKLPSKSKGGLPVESTTYRFASHDREWVKAENRGAIKRTRRIRQEFMAILSVFLVFILCFVKKIRKMILGVLNRRIGVLSSEIFRPYLAEINLLTIITTLLIYIEFHLTIKKALFNEIPKSEYLMVFLYMFLFFILLPLLFALVYALFNKHGPKIIFVCYAAFFIKFFTEFLYQDNVDLSEMRKIPIDTFSTVIQKALREQQLENKVYQEIYKSNSINAALVGWGPYEHIEIYGNHEKFSDEEFESILLHEIGHSVNHSLIKKMAVLTVIKILEMLLILHLYFQVSKTCADELFSEIGAFIILYFLYLAVLHKWVMVIHKTMSQIAELDSDLFAKSLKYGHELSKVLYRISVESEDYLSSTMLYNLLKSYHPAVFWRIEYLNN